MNDNLQISDYCPSCGIHHSPHVVKLIMRYQSGRTVRVCKACAKDIKFNNAFPERYQAG